MDNFIVQGLVLAPVTSFVIGLLATFLVRRAAVRLKWIYIPREDRWNTRVVALMGGIAVFCSFLVTYAFFMPEAFLWVLAGSVLMFATGFWDDRYEMKPILKFLFQFIAASGLIMAGYSINSSWYFWVDIPLTYLWIVGIINAFNLLDNIDGLAAGTAVIICLVFGGLALKLNMHEAAMLSFIVAGAAGGFLVFNYNPAKIFMGDCGSLFIGYMISALPLMLGPALQDIASVSILPVVVAVAILPIFDTTLVTVARIFKGRSPSQGGSDHSSHRLVFSGLTEKMAVNTLLGISTFFGILVLLFYPEFIQLFYILFSINVVGIFFFGLYLLRLDVYEQQSASKIESLVERVPGYIKSRIQLMAIIADIVLVIASFTLAHYIRFESWNPYIEGTMVKILPGVIVLKVLIFAMAGLYRKIWRYAGISELLRIMLATFTGSLGSCIFAWFYLGQYISVSVFAIDFLLLLFLLASSRFSWKGLRKLFSLPGTEGENVLLYGAGDAGWMALTEIRQNPALNLNPVGFIDDSPYKTKGKLQGLEVLGNSRDLLAICEEYAVEQLLICIRNLSLEKKEKVMQLCEDKAIRCKEFIPVFDEVDNNRLKKEPLNTDYQNGH